jgi:hypothetical protein
MGKAIYLSLVWAFLLCSPALADLVENGDGTVTDTVTGLMWQQAEAGTMTWDAALAYCESLVLAGHSDWRLPNRNELQSIVDYVRYKPSIDKAVFPGSVSSRYWSSTTDAFATECAWCVNFENGYIQSYIKANSFHVRAVRGGK